MKRILILLLAVAGVSTIATGCNFSDNATPDGSLNKTGMVNPDPNSPGHISNQQVVDRLGFVKYTRDEVAMDDNQGQAITFDRNAVADMITRTILTNEGFHEVATLVTDEEVLIAYEKEDTMEQSYAADIARKTAESVMPRYYEIYVTDNASLMSEIGSLRFSSSGDPNYETSVEQIVNEMQKTSQGADPNNMMNKDMD